MANSVASYQTAHIGAVYSGSSLFASILNSSVMLGKYLQQTTSADDIFRCILFLYALTVNTLIWWVESRRMTATEATGHCWHSHNTLFNPSDQVTKVMMYLIYIQNINNNEGSFIDKFKIFNRNSGKN